MFDTNITKQIQSIVSDNQNILVVQADNPDADSLGSALALEDLLHKLGKNHILYCGVDMPQYLHYMEGWDRVNSEFPKSFDASIIVDASTIVLLEKITSIGAKGWLAAKPCIVLDHHKEVDNAIDFATATINIPEYSSTTELIYYLAKELEWPLNDENCLYLMAGIIGDTQNLTNDLAKSRTFKTVAEMIDIGVNRAVLEEKRRELSKMPEKIYRYKSELINRTQITDDGAIATVTIPQNEINDFSPLYNPVALIQGDMLQIDGVRAVIVFKDYSGSKITGAIRTISNFPYAGQIASRFGGGGHEHASGFKVLDGTPIDRLKTDVIAYTSALMKDQSND